MVEVFKTNVDCLLKAEEILKNFRQQFMVVEASFDLEDCDKIFRICMPYEIAGLDHIVAEIFQSQNCFAHILENPIEQKKHKAQRYLC